MAFQTSTDLSVDDREDTMPMSDFVSSALIGTAAGVATFGLIVLDIAIRFGMLNVF